MQIVIIEKKKKPSPEITTVFCGNPSQKNKLRFN